MAVAYVGLGSNLRQPEQQVREAIGELAQIGHCRLLGHSKLYRSSPMGPVEQPDYINAVLALETGLEPLPLLQEFQRIEDRHGRVRDSERWGPRTLDLDLLLYDDRIIDQPGLQVPHPGLYTRNFVLYPLHELAPDLVIPGHGPLKALLVQCGQAGLWALDEQGRSRR